MSRKASACEDRHPMVFPMVAFGRDESVGLSSRCEAPDSSEPCWAGILKACPLAASAKGLGGGILLSPVLIEARPFKII